MTAVCDGTQALCVLVSSQVGPAGVIGGTDVASARQGLSPAREEGMHLSTSASSPGGRWALRKPRRMSFWAGLGVGVLSGW